MKSIEIFLKQKYMNYLVFFHSGREGEHEYLPSKLSSTRDNELMMVDSTEASPKNPCHGLETAGNV